MANNTLGAAIDRLFVLRRERFALVARANKIGEEEKELEDKLFAKYKKDELKGARSPLATCTVKMQDVANIEDFDAAIKHIIKTKSYDLLRKQFNNEACRERWEAGEKIPGVTKFTRVSLSLTAAKKTPARRTPRTKK